jgi:nucleoside-diphosphate-sugar epimerase
MCPGSVEAPAPGSGKAVCVMDASGPLGAALVDRLLRRGYTVHAATYDCRGCGGREEQEVSRGGGRLKVFRADPFDYHAIADAVRGCAGVFCMFNTPQEQGQCDVS